MCNYHDMQFRVNGFKVVYRQFIAIYDSSNPGHPHSERRSAHLITEAGSAVEK